MTTPQAPSSSKLRPVGFFLLASFAASGWVVAWWRGSTAQPANTVASATGPNAAEVRALEDRLRMLEFENQSLRAQPIEPEPRQEIAQATPAARPERGPDFEPPQNWGNRAGGRGFAERMRENPAFAESVQKEIQLRMESRYAGLIRKMRLTPDQSRQLIGLLTSRELTRMTLRSTASESGVDMRDPAAVADFTAKMQAPINEAIASLIGDNGVSQLTDWDRAAPSRDQVARLESRLSVSGWELQPSQRDALTGVLASQPGEPSRPRSNDPEAWQTYFSEREATLRNTVLRAQTVLNAQQANELADILQTQLRAEQLRYEARQASRAQAQSREDSPDRR